MRGNWRRLARCSTRPPPVVAQRLANVAVGVDSVSTTDLQAMSSVLDRTVGKVPTEVRIGLADQTMQVLDMLELEG